MLSSRKAFGGILGLTLILSAPARAAEPSKYVPADAVLVIHVNVQQLLDSNLVRKYALPPLEQALTKNKRNEEVQQVLKGLGLDPAKDIHSITVSTAVKDSDKILVSLRGKFNLDKIHATAQKVAGDKKDSFKISKAGDKSLYEVTQQGKTVYAGVADEGTLLASPSRDYVADALGSKTGKISQELANAVAAADGKQSIWAVAVVTDGVKTFLGQRQEAAGLVSKLKAVCAGINVSDALAVSLKVQTTDPQAARELGKQANDAKAVLQFVGQTNEELKPFTDEIVKTLEIKTQQADVNVKFQLSQDLIEKAIKKVPGQ